MTSEPHSGRVGLDLSSVSTMEASTPKRPLAMPNGRSGAIVGGGEVLGQNWQRSHLAAFPLPTMK